MRIINTVSYPWRGYITDITSYTDGWKYCDGSPVVKERYTVKKDGRTLTVVDGVFSLSGKITTMMRVISDYENV